MKRPILLWTFAGLLLLLPVCNDESETSPDANAQTDASSDIVGVDLQADSAPDADDGAELPPNSLQLVIETYAEDGPHPAPDALVAFDLPDGSRVEAVADENGRVTFDDIDWVPGETAAITTYLEGHEMWSVTGLTEERVAQRLGTDGLLHVRQGNITSAPTFVTVGGRLLNMVDEAHAVTVSASVFGSDLWQGDAPNWSLNLPTGESFTIVATEWDDGNWGPAGHFTQHFYGWTAVDCPPLSSDETMDIDMSQRLPTTTVTGTVPFPQYWITWNWPDVSFYMTVRSQESFGQLFIGAPTYFQAAEDWSSFDFEMEYAELEGATPATSAWVQRGQELSFLLWPGPPSSGLFELPFVQPPRVSRFLRNVRPGDVVQWAQNDIDRDDDTLTSFLTITNVEETELLHGVLALERTSTVIPLPPSGVTPADIYSPEGSSARVQLCDLDEQNPYVAPCVRVAQSRRFSVVP